MDHHNNFCRLEIYEELKDVDYVLVPVGGGGLISGIAGYLKSVNPSIKVTQFLYSFQINNI